MSSKLFGTLASIIFLIGLAAGLAFFAKSPTPALQEMTSSNHPAVKIHVPVDLDGMWETTDKSKPKMRATIGDLKIRIDYVDGDGFVCYWLGTFYNPKNENEAITSSAHEVDGTFALSSAPTKEFFYKDDQLHFSMTVMGRTTVIDLARV